MSGDLPLTLLIIAKAPAAGRSKTRLCPPCTPDQAARLAEAALRDTLATVARIPVRSRRLVLDGEPGGWVPPGFDVLPQRQGGLAERMAGAFECVEGPALLVGMDTPQADPALLVAACELLLSPGADAVLGRAADGGYWSIGLRRPDPAVFANVPMSTSCTAEIQRRRLDRLGLRTQPLRVLRDVDTYADALAVAREAPGSRFARELGRQVRAPAA